LQSAATDVVPVTATKIIRHTDWRNLGETLASR
jgi:hypothetical protein